MPKLDDYKSPMLPTWCPGCGDFGIWLALRQALVNLGKDPHDVVIVYGVGCSGNMASLVRTYGFHSLHGRALASAFGVKVSNPNLTVVVVAGDGDTYSEGIGHFVSALRQNLDINLIVHDNHNFSLTTGQASPTSPQGRKTKATPLGTIDRPLKPLHMAVTQDASFVARGFAADIPNLTKLFEDMINHTGFSYADVIQHCPTYDKDHTVEWYRDHVKPLPKQRLTKAQALQYLDKPNKLYTGIFYQDEKSQSYHEHLPQLKKGPLPKHKLGGVKLKDEFLKLM